MQQDPGDRSNGPGAWPDWLESNMADRICIVPDCKKSQLARGLCPMHYQRRRQTGTTDPPRRPDAEERFFAMVAQAGECWDWTGYVAPAGYGYFNPAGWPTTAHRWAYEFMRAEVPEGLHLDHLCRRRACVNPWHLEPVTPDVNYRRGLDHHKCKPCCPETAKKRRAEIVELAKLRNKVQRLERKLARAEEREARRGSFFAAI